MRTIHNHCLAVLGLLALAGCDQSQTTADTVYLGGPVITMNDAEPLAQAVAVKDGRILAVGSEEAVLAMTDEQTRRIDLAGNTLLPGFVDSHGHAYMMGLQARAANLLPAPDGTGNSIADIQRLLREWAEANPKAIDKVGWIAGFGYDDSQLQEQRHPTREELDAVSTELPVIIIHQSGHLGVANSKALELAGVTDATPDPDGGAFRRAGDGVTPNGVAEEYAFFMLLGGLAANFDESVNDLFIAAGTELATTYGYTTVQEGRAVGPALAAMQRAADAGSLKVDLVTYPDILEVDAIEPSRTYTNHFRIGGAKLTIDGSPQGKTAWLTEPYFIPPEGQPADYRGYAAIDADTTNTAIDKAYAQGMQLLVHANGDAAIDAFIEGVRAAQLKYPDAGDLRPVLIHGQTLREDQVDALRELGIFPSLFPMHTFYWGDWHRDSVLGPERAENISPTGWLMERDMIFGTHHDAPVALPNSMRVLSATVTRRTRSGDILGPQHRVPVMTALKAMTLWPAWQHFEEDRKGSIEPGKLADFVVLSNNPLEVAEDQLVDIEVVETIKEGVSVYRR
jgi:predicted amidohydrolase YtcJ